MFTARIKRGRRDSDSQRVTSHSCAPPVRGPAVGAGAAETIAVYTADDPLFLCRIHDQIPMLALRRPA